MLEINSWTASLTLLRSETSINLRIWGMLLRLCWSSTRDYQVFLKLASFPLLLWKLEILLFALTTFNGRFFSGRQVFQTIQCLLLGLTSGERIVVCVYCRVHWWLWSGFEGASLSSHIWSALRLITLQSELSSHFPWLIFTLIKAICVLVSLIGAHLRIHLNSLYLISMWLSTLQFIPLLL